MSHTLLTVLFVAACFAGVYFLGYVWGYDAGVKHTEERWSDAVGRKGSIS